MNSVTKKAYGKVNLFLSVGGLRSDGKHDVENVMCRVGIYDTVTVTKTGGGIVLDCADADILKSKENLAYTAAAEYISRFSLCDGVSIKIEKRIPVKAGMAGGSADGAAVLLAMNELFGKAELKELVEIASEMGADVPFFLYEKPVMLGRGTGTALTELPRLNGELYGLFVTHGQKQSTGAMFSLLDSVRGLALQPKSAECLISALGIGAQDDVLKAMHNDFELCTEHFEEVKQALFDAGAKRVLLSGSGPTVFGVFESELDARAAACTIPYRSFVCEIGV